MDGLRFLMHDTGAGFSAVNPFYTGEEIIDSLLIARDDLVRVLATSPSPPYVTLSQMTKICPGQEGDATPVDFWRLICGYKTSGQYVPAVSIRIGEAMRDVTVDQIYAKSGAFSGTADFALYWGMPSQAIAHNSAPLTEFGDAFYNAVKYKAALNLLAKEEQDTWARQMSLQEDLQRKILSFN